MEKKKVEYVNIVKIAEKANVSTATVSRVLNNPNVVKKETRERVLAEIERANYMSNAVARHLRTRRSFTIGLIQTSVLMNFYSSICLGIEDVARRNNYNVILCNSGDDPEIEEKELRILHEKRVDGFIVSPTGQNAATLQRIVANNIPVCFIDRTIEGLACDSVLVNNRQATYDAVNYVLDLGYSRIGYISGAQSIFTQQERLQGYRQALSDRSMPIAEDYIVISDTSYEAGRKAALTLLNKTDVDCLFVSMELHASGAMQALIQENTAIPDKVGFIMWDDPQWTTMVRPQVTVVSQPTYTIGATACEILMGRLLDKPHQESQEPINVVLQAKLVVRGSV